MCFTEAYPPMLILVEGNNKYRTKTNKYLLTNNILCVKLISSIKCEVLFMKRETFFLKAAVILIGIPILAFCIFGLPWIAKELKDHFPAYELYPIIIGMYS